jgi:hypothetical protein
MEQQLPLTKKMKSEEAMEFAVRAEHILSLGFSMTIFPGMFDKLMTVILNKNTKEYVGKGTDPYHALIEAWAAYNAETLFG